MAVNFAKLPELLRGTLPSSVHLHPAKVSYGLPAE
jgi:hypothetical protein